METTLVIKDKMKVSAVFPSDKLLSRLGRCIMGGLLVFVCLLFNGEGSKEICDVTNVSAYMRFCVYEFHYSLSFYIRIVNYRKHCASIFNCLNFGLQ